MFPFGMMFSPLVHYGLSPFSGQNLCKNIYCVIRTFIPSVCAILQFRRVCKEPAFGIHGIRREKKRKWWSFFYMHVLYYKM